MKFPYPTLVNQVVLKAFPSVAKAVRLRDKAISNALISAFDAFSKENTKKQDIKSAPELMVLREVQAAEKDGREARPDTPQLRDELYGFIVAGEQISIVYSLSC